ncbi:MAG TPA: serine hydrolase domain-containing protein [Thermoanaerobaculia bacterium]|nr:serine hydrolase domain-containing protein [Thermoanaerobaculia bacterium]
MNRRSFLHASAAAVGASALSCAHVAPVPDAETPLDLATLLEVLRTPGLAAQGTIQGRPFLHVAGVREVGKPDPVLPTTMFSAASLTKPVFTMAVRELVRSGRLEWHKPLQDYAPLGLTGDAATITTGHVLSHGTGLPNWRFEAGAQLASAFPPGTRWQYSGEGYVLLQRVVEKLVGRPLGGFLNTVLLPSLGMTSSTFTWTPDVETKAVAGHDTQGRLLERSAAFYVKGSHALIEKAGTTMDAVTYDQYIDIAQKAKSFAMPVAAIPNAAGSLWTTIGDYFSFVTQSIADQAAHPDEYTARNRVNAQISWALSWGVDTSLGAPALFHWGDGPGVKNFVWWQPSTNTALVIFTNSDHGAPAYRVLMRRLLGADPIAPEWV